MAAAGEPSEAPACKGVHSLWSPLPDACLETIDTDRPHQTDTPHTVPAGHSQFESALASAQLGGTMDAPPGERGAHLVFMENAYKFGVVSHVDVQLLFKHAEYVVASERFVAPGPLNVRAKFNIVEEDGWVPAITLVPTLFIPIAPAHSLRGGVIVFWGWELPLHFELEMNAGALASAGSSPKVAPVLASALTHPIVSPLRAFIDVYATGPDVALGTGLLLPLDRDVQIDAGTYMGVNGNVYAATPFVGLAVRR
jgi:hypothetical protein